MPEQLLLVGGGGGGGGVGESSGGGQCLLISRDPYGVALLAATEARSLIAARGLQPRKVGRHVERIAQCPWPWPHRHVYRRGHDGVATTAWPPACATVCPAVMRNNMCNATAWPRV